MTAQHRFATPGPLVLLGVVQDAEVQTYQLHCAAFSVDVRLVEIDGRWIASADTMDGPTLGCGTDSFAALWQALAALC